jgi:adenylate cyclase
MLISWPREHWTKTGNHYPILLVGKIWMAQKDQHNNQSCLDRIDNIRYQLSTLPAGEDELDEDSKAQVRQMRENLKMLGDPNELLEAKENLTRQIEEDKKILRKIVQDKVVFVGSIATGVPDFVVSPLDKRTPGVVVHANILNTILQWYFFRTPHHPLMDTLVIILVGAIMTMITAYYRPLVSGLGVIFFTLLIIWVNFALAFGKAHYWLNVVNPVVVTILTFVAVTFYRQITEGKARRRITARFKQYTSPAVVDRIVSSGAELSLAGETRQISCYFSDLAGFTTISEKLGPEKTVSVLNIYLDRMTEVLDRHFATVNKFQGDGIFAFFGAPIAQPDHSRLACLAALDTQAELRQLVEQQRQTDPLFPPLKMRVGISTGEVVVGDCGSHRRFDYTAIGDTVNLGARLESANKYFGTKIMICQNCYRQNQETIEARCLGAVRVVGKKQGIGVYELLGRKGDLDPDTRQFVSLFESAVRYFQNREFAKAAENLDCCLQSRPHDKAALLYQKTIQSLLQTGIPDSFDGCLELTEK